MINLFFKTSLVTIISMMLSFGELISFADTKGTLIKNKDGTVERTNTYNLAGGSASDDSAMQILTMLSVAFVGTKLISYQKWTPDMTVAAGASAVYLGGEVINLMNYKKKVDEVEAKVKFTDGTADSAQVEYIKQLKQSYEDVKGALKTKKTLQTAAMVGFLAAAGIATYQFFDEEMKLANCEMAIASNLKLLGSCVASNPVPSEKASCSSCVGGIGLFQTDLTALKTNKVPDGRPSVTKLELKNILETKLVTEGSGACASGVVSKGVQTSTHLACAPFLTSNKLLAAGGVSSPLSAMNSIELILGKKLYSNNNFKLKANPDLQTKLKSLISYVIPSAQAGWMSVLGIGGGVAAAFLTTNQEIGLTVDQAIFSPMGRIAVWGGFTLLTKLAIGGTESKIAEMENNISKIDKIINEMNKLSSGVKASNSVLTKAVTNSSGLTSADYAISSGIKTGCSNSSCKTIAAQVGDSVSAISGLPVAFSDAAKGVASISDSLSNKGAISSGTISSASSLGSSANAISNKLKGLQSAINQKLTSKGQSPKDFDGLANNFKNNLLKSSGSSLKSSGVSPSTMLASLGLSPSSTNAVEDTKEAAKKITDTNSAIPVSSTKKEGLDLSEENRKEDLQMALGSNEGKPKYDMEGTDVSKDKGANIFDIISSRYLKSAFPKLLEEEKK